MIYLYAKVAILDVLPSGHMTLQLVFKTISIASVLLNF